MKKFEQECVILNSFLNQGELSDQCSFIGLKYSDLDPQCLFNTKHLFPEMLSPKHHGQVSFDKKGYQDAVIVSFTAKPPTITTAIHTGEQIYYPFFK